MPRSSSIPITSDLLLAVLAFFIPPFPVFVKMGLSIDLLINIVLTLLGAFPGIIHAWYIILKYPDDGVPVVQDWISRHHIIAQSDAQGPTVGGYTQISDDPGALESGVMPGAYSNNNNTNANINTNTNTTHNNYAPAPSNYSGPSTSSSNPPPYANQGTFVPGDNKIQYGSQL